jgi:hypothetical protein
MSKRLRSEVAVCDGTVIDDPFDCRLLFRQQAVQVVGYRRPFAFA